MHQQLKIILFSVLDKSWNVVVLSLNKVLKCWYPPWFCIKKNIYVQNQECHGYFNHILTTVNFISWIADIFWNSNAILPTCVVNATKVQRKTMQYLRICVQIEYSSIQFGPLTHAQRNFSEVLFNQPEIRLY